MNIAATIQISSPSWCSVFFDQQTCVRELFIVEAHLATPNQVTGTPLKYSEQIIISNITAFKS